MNLAGTPRLFARYIVGFGGSFVGGSRGQVDFLCEDYAALGYVAVHDYRIGFFIPSSISTALAVLRGAHDTERGTLVLCQPKREIHIVLTPIEFF